MSQSSMLRGMAGVAAGLMVAVAASATLAAQGAKKTVNDGVYSAPQADRGKKWFEGNCTTCHDPGRFTGDFVKVWSGQPLHVLYDLMRTTMPEDNPGALKPEQYADVLAYFLQLNKYPTGAEELSPAAEVLKGIQMELPKKADKGAAR